MLLLGVSPPCIVIFLFPLSGCVFSFRCRSLLCRLAVLLCPLGSSVPLTAATFLIVAPFIFLYLVFSVSRRSTCLARSDSTRRWRNARPKPTPVAARLSSDVISEPVIPRTNSARSSMKEASGWMLKRWRSTSERDEAEKRKSVFFGAASFSSMPELSRFRHAVVPW